MRACWLKWVGRDWSISADYIWLNYSGANNGVSKKGAKKMTPYTTTIRFGVTLGVKKEKGQRFNTSDLCFRWWAIQDSNL